MSKSNLAIAATTLSLAAATLALAQDYDDSYPYALSHHALRLQIEGGHTITEGSQDRNLDNGQNLGLGFTWQPLARLPLAFRADGMYEKFEIRPPLLVQAASYFGTSVDEGSAKMWGGDIDAELDFPVSYWARLYLLGGVGWYDQQNSYRQFTFGASQTSMLVGRNSTGMRFEKNAGVGAEFAIGDRASFFVDARFMRFGPSGAKSDFVPIRFGVRY